MKISSILLGKCAKVILQWHQGATTSKMLTTTVQSIHLPANPTRLDM